MHSLCKFTTIVNVLLRTTNESHMRMQCMHAIWLDDAHSAGVPCALCSSLPNVMVRHLFCGELMNLLFLCIVSVLNALQRINAFVGFVHQAAALVWCSSVQRWCSKTCVSTVLNAYSIVPGPTRQHSLHCRYMYEVCTCFASLCCNTCMQFFFQLQVSRMHYCFVLPALIAQ